MRNPGFLILIGITSMLILAGCSGTTNNSDLAGKLSDIKEAAQEQDTSAKEETDKKEPEVEDGTEEAEDESVNAGATPASFAEAFEEKGTVVNGSYFVRIGNKVYFRKISPDSMKEGAEFGEFLHAEFTPTKCPLICFDLDTGKYEEIGNITGVGELYACPEGFYIGEMNPDSLDSSTTDLYDIATSESNFYCDGVPCGVSKSGKLLAVEQQAGTYFSMALIKDGKEAVALGDENNYYSYCGFAGEDLILIQRKDWGGEADEEWVVCSVTENGEVTQLGSMGTYDEGYPEIQEFRFVNGSIYLTVGYFEGTGHFLSHWTAFKAVPGMSGSLEEITEGRDDYNSSDEEGPENEVPKICFDTGGYLFYSPYTPYKAYMGTGDNSNNMYYYDESYEGCILLRDFIRNDYGEKCQIIQDITTYPEYVFVIYADAEEDDEYSIGWRTGYKMTGWHICAIPCGYGQDDENSAAEGIVYFD